MQTHPWHTLILTPKSIGVRRNIQTSSATTQKSTKVTHTTIIQDTILTTRSRLIADFEQVDDRYIDITTIHGFLAYIEDERLTHMPHRGSRWDRVLKWAEFYAMQVAAYEDNIAHFVPESKQAATLIYVACRVLLEVWSPRIIHMYLAYVP